MQSRKRSQFSREEPLRANTGEPVSSSRRAAKRQRVEDPSGRLNLRKATRKDDDDDDDDEEEEEQSEDDSQAEIEPEGDDEFATADEGADALEEEDNDGGEEDQEEDLDNDDDDDDGGDESFATPKPKKLKALSSRRLEASQKAVKRTGVIYISRVPPFMKPQAVRHLLSPYGEIGRIFLTPEDPEAHKRRVKSGGNKKKSFTDGWVEFLNKKEAKLVAETLNTQIIGGKKRGWYHDDVWNIKYLKGFKWHHLTEQIANENAERAARMRAEIAQTTRENKIFLQNIEKAKVMETREEKKKRKKSLDSNGGIAAASGASVAAGKDEKSFRSYFRQNEVKLKTAKDRPTGQSDDVKRVLSKIF